MFLLARRRDRLQQDHYIAVASKMGKVAPKLAQMAITCFPDQANSPKNLVFSLFPISRRCGFILFFAV